MKKYTLENEEVKVVFTDLGGSLLEIHTKDREGSFENILLGYEDLTTYEFNPSYMGCIVGPSAGRTANASFNIDGVNYQLEDNFMGHNLHGGRAGISFKTWDVEKTKKGYRLSYLSQDGEGGYPGNVEYAALYELEGSSFSITLEAVSDKDTHINLTMHPYFRMKSPRMWLPSDEYCEVDDKLIPSGRMISVRGTEYDLSKGEVLTGNFDNAWKLTENAVRVASDESGREITFRTNQDYVIVYTYIFPDSFNISDGRKGIKNEAFAIEFQNMPNEINLKERPKTLIRAGEKYINSLTYEFGVK